MYGIPILKRKQRDKNKEADRVKEGSLWAGEDEGEGEGGNGCEMFHMISRHRLRTLDTVVHT